MRISVAKAAAPEIVTRNRKIGRIWGRRGDCIKTKKIAVRPRCPMKICTSELNSKGLVLELACRALLP